MKDSSCFKIKSYIAFRAQFLSSPCSRGKKMLPHCFFSRWDDKQSWPMASLQPGTELGMGHVLPELLPVPSGKTCKLDNFYFLNIILKQFPCHLTCIQTHIMVWKLFSLLEKPLEASNNAGTLWCGESGQVRGLKLESEDFTSRFLMTLHARPDIPQLSLPNLYKNTYLNKPEGLSPIHEKTNLTPTHKPLSSSCHSLD